MSFQIKDINSKWTLFLDRDGVINKEKQDDYIRNWSEFEFYPNCLIALALLANKFERIVITTNQKGVGKKWMTETDLLNIHTNMSIEIQKAGGRIDHVFYCTDLDNQSINRKPQAGMAFQAQEMFPEIHFSNSIMVGNRISDMQFGRNAGMHTVFLATTHPETPYPDPTIDYRFDNLFAFAKAI